MNSFLLMLVIIFINLFSSCSSTPNHIIEADKIINKFTHSLAKSGYKPFGVGGSFFDSIEGFSLHYELRSKTVSLDKARELIIEKTEELIRLINNSGAKPHIKSFPLDENNIILSLIFVDDHLQYHNNGQITKTCLYKGDVSYIEHVPSEFKELQKEKYSETYLKVYGKSLPNRKTQFGIDFE